MAGLGNIVIRIGADTAGAVRDIGKVNTALGEQMTRGQKASSALKKAAVPAAAAFTAAVGAIGSFTKAAAEDMDAQASLARSLHKTTGATSAQIKAAEDYISKLSSATGVTDDEMRPALEKLAAASGSTVKGQKQLALAADIAQSAHVSLAAATKAVVAADAGRLGALKKLVPGIKDATIKSKDQAGALDEAAKLTGGSALANAKTYGGQMKVMANQVGEAQESIGTLFLPVLAVLVPVLKSVTDFVSKNTTAFGLLLGAVAAIAGAVLLANAAMKVYQATTVIVRAATATWTAIQWLFNAAMSANPVVLVVIALAALVAGVILAYKSFDGFRELVDKVWSAVKSLASGAVDVLKVAFDNVKAAGALLWTAVTAAYTAVLPALKLAFDGVKAATKFVSDHFDDVKAAGELLWTALKTAYNAVLPALKLAFDGVKAAVGFVSDHFDTVRAAGELLWTALKTAVTLYLTPFRLAFDGIKAAITFVVDLLEDGFATGALDTLKSAVDPVLTVVKAVVGWFKDLAGMTFGPLVAAIKSVIEWISKIKFPELPGWLKDAGGFVGGHIPFTLAPPSPGAFGLAGSGPRAAAPSAVGAGGGLTINVFGALDAEGTARQIRRLLDGHDRRQGRIA